MKYIVILVILFCCFIDRKTEKLYKIFINIKRFSIIMKLSRY